MIYFERFETSNDKTIYFQPSSLALDPFLTCKRLHNQTIKFIVMFLSFRFPNALQFLGVWLEPKTCLCPRT